ncbi:hypothetical protein TrVFT333_009173 [Trichoderma virens FT-333]|nr:hypothetical protein TrVFT333_009173 [Trichoderma virens FT-333]
MSYYNKRWRGRGGHQNFRPRNPLVQSEASPPPPLGELIERINQKDIEGTAGEIIHFGISGSELVASYNWADQKAPKIIVPGRPPLWKPLEKPRELLEDNGVYFRDNNSAFFPKHPLEPAIVSVMKMHPSSLHIDLVGCNSTIGNLLRFVQGVDRSFRMLVEVVGKTIHFIRRENSPTEQILGVRGFGHAFPEAYTIWAPDVRPSKSHHRILKYQFGGLDLLLRQSSDGYIEEKNTNTITAAEPSAVNGKDLVSHLESLSIGTSSASPPNSGYLEVVDGGQPTSQESIFDLKTRSIKAIQKDTLGEELPRLWLAQIPNFILAHHSRGTFNNIEVTDVRDEIQDWEKSHQQDLSRLSALLHRIIATALEKQDTAIEIVRQQGESLEIRQRLPDAGIVFSDHVKEQWLDWLGYSGDVEEAHGSGERSGDCGSDNDSDSGDFTACNEECGYCGKCSS